MIPKLLKIFGLDLVAEVVRLRKENKLLSRVADAEHARAEYNEQFTPNI